MVRVGHTSAIRFNVYAKINDSNVRTALGECNVAYGVSNVAVTRQSGINSVTNIAVIYNNSNYELQVAVSYTGGTAPAIHFSVEGLSSENFVAQ